MSIINDFFFYDKQQIINSYWTSIN
jgi:hypothetical protein